MSTAVILGDEINAELQPIRQQLVRHPYVSAVEQRLIETSQLRPFAGEQHTIISSDLRSVAHLVSRFGPGLFTDTLAGEQAALAAVVPFAAALGMSEQDLQEY